MEILIENGAVATTEQLDFITAEKENKKEKKVSKKRKIINIA